MLATVIPAVLHHGPENKKSPYANGTVSAYSIYYGIYVTIQWAGLANAFPLQRILMPLSNTSLCDNSGADPVYIPRLAVRNRWTDDGSTDYAAPSCPRSETGSTRPAMSNRTSAQTVVPVLERKDSDKWHESGDCLAGGVNVAKHDDTRKTKRDLDKKDVKKTKSVLGFLTLKDPSTSAWEEYAWQERKKTAEKTGRTVPVGMPGMSSKKLPDYVPKVNSKWDGMPESAKRKTTETNLRDKTVRNSMLSTSTRHSTLRSEDGHARSSGWRIGTLSSRPMSSTATIPRHASSQTVALSAECQAASYGSPPIAVHPAFRAKSPESVGDADPSGNGASSFLLASTPPPILPKPSGPLPSPELDIFDHSLVHKLALPSSSHLTGAESSSKPPPVDKAAFESVIPTTTDHGLPARVRPLSSESYGTLWLSDTDDEKKPKLRRIGAFSAAPNFSRPISVRPEPRSVPSESVLQDEQAHSLDRLRAEPRSLPKEVAMEKGEAEDSLSLRESDGEGSGASRVSEAVPGPTRQESIACTNPVRTLSKSSDLTSLGSPAFSAVFSESTRPSTAASSTSTVRRRSLSPIRSEGGRKDSDAKSIAPSVATSELSLRWSLTPKERLGLGGKVVRREEDGAAPWETDEKPATGPSVKRRSGMLVQASQEAGKLKRLSMRLGVK